MSDTPPEIFDRKRRALTRARAARIVAADPDADFLRAAMAEELIERLGWVTRSFSEALVLGDAGSMLADALEALGMAVTRADAGAPADVRCEEDRLPFDPARFDLVASVGALDSVNDLPGALVQIRRVLRPDGLFLASFIGAGSLVRLKAAMLAADEAARRGAAAHVHPQIELRAIGDLLQRAGFAMPVADGERLTVRYSGLPGLVRDLRAMAGSNVLAGARGHIGKAGLLAAAEHFATTADADGRTAETFELIHISGWAPSPDQPKPARRGSATASLAEALRKGPDQA